MLEMGPVQHQASCTQPVSTCESGEGSSPPSLGFSGEAKSQFKSGADLRVLKQGSTTASTLACGWSYTICEEGSSSDFGTTWKLFGRYETDAGSAVTECQSDDEIYETKANASINCRLPHHRTIIITWCPFRLHVLFRCTDAFLTEKCLLNSLLLAECSPENCKTNIIIYFSKNY